MQRNEQMLFFELYIFFFSAWIFCCWRLLALSLSFFILFSFYISTFGIFDSVRNVMMHNSAQLLQIPPIWHRLMIGYVEENLQWKTAENKLFSVRKAFSVTIFEIWNFLFVSELRLFHPLALRRRVLVVWEWACTRVCVSRVKNENQLDALATQHNSQLEVLKHSFCHDRITAMPFSPFAFFRFYFVFLVNFPHNFFGVFCRQLFREFVLFFLHFEMRMKREEGMKLAKGKVPSEDIVK